jgi:hypothetical protein
MSAGQNYLYGKPIPVTGVCTVCNSRVRLKKDGTLWSHRRKPSKPVCQGSGMPPRPGSIKRKWPPSATRSKSLRAVSGGAVESSRRRH